MTIGFQYSGVLRALVITTLIFATGQFVSAQNLPLALKKNTDLSPRNAEEYKKLIKQYKEVSCLGLAENETCEKRDDAEATRLRNNLIFMVKAQADAEFSNYRTKRRRGGQAFEIFMDILELAASTAISITNGERAKTIIADGLTMAQLSRKSVAKNLKLQEMQVLFNVMEKKRAVIYKGILENMRSSDSIYSFPIALSDIMLYVKAGTIDEALAELATETGKSRDDAVKEAERIEQEVLKPVPTEAEAKKVSLGYDTLVGLGEKLKDNSKEAAASTQLKTIARRIVSELVGPLRTNREFIDLKTEFEKDTIDAAKLGKAILTLRGSLYYNDPRGKEFNAINQIIIDEGKEK